MDRETIEALAKQAGVRIFGHWLEGHQDALYRFAELLVEHERNQEVGIEEANNR